MSSDPCDDSIIMRVLVHWVDSNISATTSPEGSRPCGHVTRGEGGVWRLAMAVQRGPGKRQRHFVDVDPMGTRPDRYPLFKLGPGIWDISKSVHVSGQFHGFVTLMGVPEPAPWETGNAVRITVKDPTFAELGEFAGIWVKKIVDACPNMNGYAVVLSRQDTIVLMSATASQDGHKAFRAALLKHLQEKSS